MVQTTSKYLVEELLGHKPREGDAEAQRRYVELPRFYVVANRYEKKKKKDTAIGDHTDSNPLYVVPPPPPATSSHHVQLGGRWDLVDFTHNEGRPAERAKHQVH